MLKSMLLLSLSLTALGAAPKKEDPGCPQIDHTKLDTDGIAFCPDLVKQNAYVVTRCAYNQAKTWHRGTNAEQERMKDLIQALKDEAPQAILLLSDTLGLQVCRQRNDNDSFLLLYTKPGKRDYNGPFLMYREGGKTSGLVLHAPHDGQDGTPRSTRDAFQNSNALALISNGHPRRISGEKKRPYASDWAHMKQDLGYTAFLAFKTKFPESVHVHIHGLAYNKVMVTDSVGWQSKHILRTAFIKATEKALKDSGRASVPVEEWRFNGWESGLSMTQSPDGKGRKDNERWVGVEFSVLLHAKTNVLTKAIINLEADYLKKPRPVDVPPIEIPEEPNDEEGKGGEEDDPVVVPEPVPPTPPNTPVPPQSPITYKYAPYPKGNVGVKKLACVGISYKNPVNDYVTADVCKKAAERTADFYRKNSNGRLKLVPEGYHFKYDGEAWASFSKAELVAKEKFDADYYIIPSIFRKGGNHASNKIAHVIQFTGWVIDHEVGHLIGLGHTGKYVYNDKGGFTLQHYGDEDSPMGNNGSQFLTPPQYYHLGWLGEKGTAMFEVGKEYELTRITQKKVAGPLFGVLVPEEQFQRPLALADVELPDDPDDDDLDAVALKKAEPKRKKVSNAFIGYPKSCPNKQTSCVALYRFQGGSSQVIKKSVDGELYDGVFTGLHIKVLESVGLKIKIKVDFEKPMRNKCKSKKFR